MSRPIRRGEGPIDPYMARSLKFRKSGPKLPNLGPPPWRENKIFLKGDFVMESLSLNQERGSERKVYDYIVIHIFLLPLSSVIPSSGFIRTIHSKNLTSHLLYQINLSNNNHSN
jgi:hypothetical protein